jgi:hypothetical protein
VGCFGGYIRVRRHVAGAAQTAFVNSYGKIGPVDRYSDNFPRSILLDHGFDEAPSPASVAGAFFLNFASVAGSLPGVLVENWSPLLSPG